MLDLTSVSTWSVLLLLLALVAKSIHRYVKRKADEAFSRAHGCEAVQQSTLKWPLGIDYKLAQVAAAKRHKILQFLAKGHEENGLTYGENVLFRRVIRTIEPANIEAILSTDFDDFSLGDRPRRLRPLLGNGIFTQEGAAWKRSRELLRPLFHNRARPQNFDEIQAATERLLGCIPADEPVDLLPLFFRFTLDTTTYLMFGQTINSLSSERKGRSEHDFAEAFRVSQNLLVRRGRYGPKFGPFSGSRELDESIKVCHGFVDEIIEDALRKDEKGLPRIDPKGQSLLSMVIEQTRDPEVLRDVMMNVLLAGRDTTASTLGFACRLLSTHQSALTRLREEVASTLGLRSQARVPTRDDIKKLPYLALVLRETLRLFPSVPANSRTPIKRVALPTGGGADGTSPVLVRPGESVVYSTYVMHRRKDLYGPDAEEFRPERWETASAVRAVENNEKRQDQEEWDLRKIGYGYLPFNGGPRICLGQEFALLEASYALIRLIQEYPHMSAAQEHPPLWDQGASVALVLSPMDGCWINMRRES